MKIPILAGYASPAPRKCLIIGVFLLFLGGLLAPIARAANDTWTGAGTGGAVWSNTANWKLTAGGGPAPTVPDAGDAATFNWAAGGQTAVTVDSNISLGSIKFDQAAFSGTTGYDILGNGITLSANGAVWIQPTLSGTGITETIENLLTLSGSSSFANWTSASSNDVLLFKGNITNNIASTLNLSGSGSGTISGRILAGVDTQSLLVTGGLWTLSGSNSFTGSTTISSGTLKLSGSGTLGDPSATLTASGGVLNLGSTIQTLGTVTFAGGTVQNGTLIGTAGYTSSGGSVSAVLGGAGGLTQNSGVLSLSAANTYSGVTTINGGTLQLNFAQAGAPSSNILSSSTNIVMGGGGTLAILGSSGTANSQSFNGITLNPGGSSIQLTSASNPLLLTLGAITRNPGGTVDFTLPAGAQSGSNGITTMATTTNGILSGWATVSGSTWAATSGSNIVGLGSYSNSYASATGTDNFDATVSGGFTSNSINSLRFNTSAAVTATLNGAFSIGSGGILVTSAVGNSPSAIVGGASLTSGTSELVVIQNNPANSLTIGSSIVDNGAGPVSLTKSGPGNLTLTGANTFSGGTIINSGTLQLGDGTANGSIASDVTDNAMLVLNNGGTQTVASNISGTGGLTKTGNSTVILTGNNTYTGPLLLNGGVLNAGTPNIDGNDTTNGIIFNSGTLQAAAAIVTNKPITLAGAGTIDTNGTVSTLWGGIGGTGSLNKIGAGTLILLGTNSYGGTTTISSGTLQLGDGTTNGSIVSNVTDNAMLAFNSVGNQTVSSIISGTGAVMNFGAGTVALTGSNSFTGPLFLNGGILNAGMTGINGGDTTNGIVFNGGTLQMAGAITTAKAVTLAGPGTIDTNGSTSTLLGVVSGTGAFGKTGAGTLFLTNVNNYTGGTTINGGVLQVSGSGTLGATSAALLASGGILDLGATSQTVGAVTIGGGTIQNGTLTGTRYTSAGGIVSAVLSGTAGLTQNSGILYLSGANTYSGGTVINGGVLQISGSGTMGATSAPLTVSNGVLNLGSTSQTVGAVSIAGGIIQSGTLTGTGYTSAGGAVSAVLSGTGGLTQNSGTLTISGVNTYSGATAINGGMLQISGSGNLGASSASLTASGGVLNLGSTGQTVGAVTIAGGTIQSGTLTGASYTSTGGVVSAVLSGSAGLTQNGGLLTLSASNTYAGVTTINSGTLQLGDGTTNGSIAGSVTDKGMLAFNNWANQTFGNIVSGTGGLMTSGSVTLTLTGTNTYTGPLYLNGGILNAGMANINGSSSTGGIIFNSGTLQAAGAIATGKAVTLAGAGTFDTNGTISTLSGVVSGTGSLNIVGAGTLLLTKANNYTGGITVSSGTLGISGVGTLGAASSALGVYGAVVDLGSTKQTVGAVTLANGTIQSGTLSGGGVTILGGGIVSAALSGTGALLLGVDGSGNSGTLYLNGSNSYSGGTTINSGTLQLGGLGTLGSKSGALAVNAGVLDLGGTNQTVGAASIGGVDQITGYPTTGVIQSGTLTISSFTSNGGGGLVSAVLAGVGGLTQNAGLLTLIGAHTYSGGTTINTGTLQLGNGVTNGSIAGSVIDNDTLAFNNVGNQTIANQITGTGGLLKLGNGTLTLTGNNSYTGSLFLNGGILNAGLTGINGNSTTNAIVFNGGTLQAAGAITTGKAITLTGGGTVDTNGATTTFSGVVSGAGALTKTGAGKLVLSNVNTYTGLTTINSGTLQVSGSGTLGSFAPLTASGGVLDLGSTSQTVGAVTIAGGTIQSGTLSGSGYTSTGGVVSAVLAGPGALTQNSGLLTLSGSNTYSGGTTINSGTLQMSGNGRLGASSSPLNAFGGVLDLGTTKQTVGAVTIAGGTIQSGTLTGASYTSMGGIVSSVLSGTGSLIQNSGLLSLSGPNTYSGGTAINSGSLQISGNGTLGASSSPLAASGGVLDLGSTSQTVGAVTIASGTIQNGTLTGSSFTSSSGGAVSAALAGSGGLTQNSGLLRLSGWNTYSGATTITGGTLQLNFAQASGPNNIINNQSNNSSLVLGGTQSSGGTLSILGSSGTANSQAFNNLTVNSGASAIQLTGNSSLELTLGAITRNSGGTVDFTLPANAQSGVNGITTTNLGSNGILGGWATVSGTTWAATSSGNIVGLTSYVNSYSGAATTDNFDATTSGTFSSTSINSLRFNTAAVVTGTLNGAFSIGSGGVLVTSAVGNNPSTIAGGTSLTSGTSDLIVIQNNTANSLTISTPIIGSGSMGLTKSGPGNLILNGSNSYTGATTINSGTLQLGDGITNGIIAGKVSDFATLAFNSAGSQTFGNVISGTGAVMVSGSGTVILTGSNTYTGPLNLNGGMLNAGMPAINGSNTTSGIIFNGGTLQAGGTLNTSKAITLTGAGTIDTNGTVSTLSGLIAGGGALTKSGSGTLVLLGSDTYSGGTIISSGTLQIGNGTTNGSISSDITVNANSMLVMNGVGTQTFGKKISGSGGLTKVGNNTLIITNNNNAYTGPLILNGGILNAGTPNINGSDTTNGIVFNGGTLQSSTSGIVTAKAVTVGASGGTFDTNGTVSTLSGIISGTGSFTKVGSGTAVLTAANTYTGATAINGGVLQLNFAQAKGLTSNIINNTALILGGGTLSVMTGTSADSQSFSGMTVNAGDSAIRISGTNSQLLTLGAITRNIGGTVDFTLPAGVQSGNNAITTTTANSSNGILGGWATVGGGTWATSTLGKIGGLASYGFDYVAATGTTNFDATTSDTFTSTSVNSLRFNYPSAVGLTTTLNGDFSITSGGILFTGTMGGPGSIMGGNSLTSGTSDLIVLQNNPANSLTISTPVINSGTMRVGLTKSGSGTLILNAANTYTGITTINNGILQLGDGYTNGSLSGSSTIVNNGTLSFNNFSPMSFGNNISGSGSLVIAGADVVTLTGSNTYTGLLTLNSATLNAGMAGINGNDSTNGIVFNGGTLQANGAISTGKAIIVNAGGVIDTNGANLILSGSVTGSGVLTKQGAGMLTLSGAGTGFYFAGGLTLNSGTLQLSGTGPLALTTGVVTINAGILDLASTSQTVGSVTMAAGTTIQSGTLTATGGLTSSGGSVSAALAGPGSVLLDVDIYSNSGLLNLSGLNSYSGGTTINSGTVQLSGLGTLGATNGALTINNGLLDLGGTNQTVGAVKLGATDINGNITQGTIQSGTLTISSFTSNGGGLVSAALLGANAQLIQNSGTLILSASNGYTGQTTVNGGALQIGAPWALGPGNLYMTGGVLDLGLTSESIGYLTLAGGTIQSGTLSASNTTTVTGGGVVNASITGATGLAVTMGTGGGVLTLGGSNSYTGGTTINSGTVQISGAGTLGATTKALTVNGVLDLGSTLQTVAGVTIGGGTIQNGTLAGTGFTSTGGSVSAGLAGTGALIHNIGKLSLSGSNSFSGATTVNGGTLTLDYPASNTNKVASVAALTLSNIQGATLQMLGNNSAATSQGVASLALKPGASTISVVSGSNQNTSLTLNTITRSSAGSTLDFELTNTGSSGIASVTDGNSVTNGILSISSVAFATVGQQYWATISGTSIVGLTTGTVGVFGGNTTLATGTTTLSSTTATNTLRFNSASTLNLQSNTLMLTSGGILVANNASGASTISGGTLYSSGNELAVHQFASSPLTISSALSASGALTLTKSGTGTLILSGNNSGLTGTVFLNSGQIQMGGPTALGTAALQMGDGTAMLDLHGNNLTVNKLTTDVIYASYGTIGAGSGLTPTITNAAAGTLATLTIGSGGNVSTFDGGLSEASGAILALTTAGSGNLNIGMPADSSSAWSNQISGAITIAAGTTLTPNGAHLLTTGALTVNGILTISNQGQTVGATYLAGNGALTGYSARSTLALDISHVGSVPDTFTGTLGTGPGLATSTRYSIYNNGTGTLALQQPYYYGGYQSGLFDYGTGTIIMPGMVTGTGAPQGKITVGGIGTVKLTGGSGSTAAAPTTVMPQGGWANGVVPGVILNGGTLWVAPSGSSASAAYVNNAGTGGIYVGGGGTVLLDSGAFGGLTLTLGSGSTALMTRANSIGYTTNFGGTLVIGAAHGLSALGTTEKFNLIGSAAALPANQNGIVAPWIVGQDANPSSPTYTNGAFLTYVGTGAGTTGQAGTDTGFQPYVSSTNNTNFATTSTNTTVELINAPVTLSPSAVTTYSVYALRVDQGGVLNLGGFGGFGNTLAIGSGSNQAGIILNGGVITGQGSINYGSVNSSGSVIGELTVYTSLAGGEIDTGIVNPDGNGNLTKFGPGTLILNGFNGGANFTINSGVLDVSGIPLLFGSPINLRGGVFQANNIGSQGGITAGVTWGSGPGGGFAAKGGALTVDLGTTVSGTFSLTNLVWGAGGNFVPEGGVLMFGSTTADSPVTLMNSIDLGGTGYSVTSYSRVINVQANSIDAARDPFHISDQAIISGTIGSTNPYHGLAKDGNGTLVLSGSNTYTGATSIANGTLLVANDAGLGVAPLSPYALNTTPGFSGGAMTLGSLVISGGANFGIYSTGTAAQTLALSPNRTILLASGTAGTTPSNIILDNLTTLQFGGQIANYINEIGALGKQGPGTLVLFGSNTYTGSTTVGNGTLRLDFTQPGAPVSNIINGASNSSNLILGTNGRAVGGILSMLGSSGTFNSQRFNGLTVGAGGSAVQLTSSSNALLLNLGTITRNIGGTVDFTLPAGVQSGSNGVITTAVNSNGILGGWATVGGSTWASGSSGNIVGLPVTGYGNSYASATGTTNFDATSSGSFTPTSINSLRFNSSAAVTGTLNGAFSVGSGGILVTSASGNNPSITGGTSLTSGAGDLIVIQNNIANPLTIRTPIVGSIGLTLSGSGTTVLSGASTYNGVTTINGGTLQLGNGTDGSVTSSGIVDNGTLIYNNTGTLTYSNPISGIGGLTKQGSGTLTLAGTNTYNGVLTLTGGTLLAATANINGGDWLNGIVFNGGTLKASTGGITTAKPVALMAPGTFDVGATVSALSGVVSGTGSLTMLGSGTLILAGGGSFPSTPFSGGLNINGGIVQCAGPGSTMLGSGNITLGASSTLDLKDSNPTTGWLTGPSNTVITNNASDTATSTLTLGGTDSQTFSGVIRDGNSAHVALVINGSGTQFLSGVNTYTGVTTISSGTVRIASDNGIGGTHGAATVLSANTSSPIVTLSSIPAGLAVGAQFLGRTVSAITSSTTLTLSANATTAITTGTGVSFAIDPTLTINGGALQVTSSFALVESDSTNLVATQNRNIILNGSSSIIDVSGANTLTIPGIISGGGGLTKANTGTLLLMQANSYTGATTVQNGTLKLGWGYAIANSLALTIGQDGAGNSATLDMGNGNYFSNVTIASLASKGTALANDVITNSSVQTGTAGIATLTVNPDLVATPVDSIFGGSIKDGASATIAITKAGSHTLTLNGTSTYTGVLTLSGGILNATTAAINGANTTNGIVFNSGTLQAGSGGINTAKAVSMLAAGTFDSNGYNSTLSGVISGSGGAVIKTGEGTLTLAGANTFTGGLVINQGTLIDGNSSGLGATNVIFGTSFSPTLDLNGNTPSVVSLLGTGSNGIVTNNAASGIGTLTITGGAAQAFGGTIQDGTSARVALSINVGAGVQILSGNNTYSGGTTLKSGVLALGSPGALGSAGTIAFTGGTLQFSSANTRDYSNRFSTAASQAYNLDTNGQNIALAYNLNSSGGVLTKLGAGTLTLTGPNNSFTGGLNINSGTVRDGNPYSGTLGSGNVTMASTAAPILLDLNGNSATVGLLSGVGSNGIVTNNALGSGTATLSLVGSGTQVFAGTIQDGATAHIALAKGGVGFEALTGTNTFTGTLTLNGGILNASTVNINGNNLTSGITFNGGTLQAALGGIATLKPVVLMSGSGGFDTNGNNSTLSGLISGTGALTKSGAGTLTLNGSKANTYTGPTVVNGGTLQLDFSNRATSNNLVNGSSALTLGGGCLSILGNNSTTQQFGNLTLTGATGGSSIVLTPSGGALGLVLGNVWTRAIGSTLLIDMSTTSGAYGSSVTITGTGTGNVSGVQAYAMVKDSTGTGFATVSSSNTIVRYNDTTGVTLAAASNSGTTNFTTLNSTYTSGTLSWTGTTARSANTLTIDTTSHGGTIDLGGTSNILTLASSAILFRGGLNETLTGGQIPLTATTELIVHQVSTTGTLTINTQIGTFPNAGAGYLTKDGPGTLILTGSNGFGNIYLNGGILESGTAGLNFQSSRQIVMNSGTLRVPAGGFTSSRSITLNGIGTVDTNGNIAQIAYVSGSGGPLVKSGLGTLRIAAAGNFSVGLIINSGTVQAGANNAFGSGSITFGSSNNPVLDIGGYSETEGALIGGPNAVVTSSTTMNGSPGVIGVSFNGSTQTFSGTIKDGLGIVALTKAGTGTEILTGSNTFTGALGLNGGILNAATVNINGGAATRGIAFNGGTLQAASGGINTANAVSTGALGGTFDTNGNDSTLSGNITGTGPLTKAGNGMLYLGGTSSTGFAGGLIINTGTVQICGASVLSGGDIYFPTSNSATLDLNGNNATVASLVSAGGNGVITNSAIDSGAGLVTSTVTLIGSRVQTFSGVIRDGISPIALTVNGPGAQILTGSNSFTGQITLNGGMLNASTVNINGGDATNGIAFNGGILQAGSGGINTGKAVTIAGGAVFDTNGANSTLSAAISGSGSFTSIGNGTLNLAGANTYTGPTSVTAGTLVVSGGIVGSVTVGSGATLATGDTTTQSTVGSLNVQSDSKGGGTLSPSAALAKTVVGSLNVQGDVTLGTASTAGIAHLAMKLGDTTAGISNDQIVMLPGSTLNLTNVQLDGSLIDGFASKPITYDPVAGQFNGDMFFLVIGVSTVNGTFANQSSVSDINIPGFNTVMIGGQKFAISYTASFNGGFASVFSGAGTDIALMAIPEPETWILLLGGLGVLGAWSRRRKS